MRPEVALALSAAVRVLGRKRRVARHERALVYALKGWIRFRFDGADEAVTVVAGSCLSQPGGVAHNVIGQSHDLEIIEINMPADHMTAECEVVRPTDLVHAYCVPVATRWSSA